jgi:hypothetical protein
MERIHRDFKLLTIAGGMQEVIGLAVDLGERELIHELHHTIIRPMDIVQREVAVDGAFQLRLGNSCGNAGNLLGPDATAIAGDARQKRPV